MSSHHQKNTVAAQKNKDGIRVMSHQETEYRCFTAQELIEYNKISPNFGVEYLKNEIEIPREILNNNQRNQNNIMKGVVISGIVIFLFFCVIFCLLYKEKYTEVTVLLGGGILSTILAFIGKFFFNHFKKNKICRLPLA